MEVDPNDLVIERVVLEYMEQMGHVRQVQFINGLKPGNRTRAGWRACRHDHPRTGRVTRAFVSFMPARTAAICPG